jgi:rubrerythrin
MEKVYPIQAISTLARLDLDASHGYELAIMRLDDDDLKTQLEIFRKDHINHLQIFNKILMDQKSKLPEQHANLSGFFLNPVVTLKNMTSNRRILQALRVGERVCVKVYSDILKFGVPDSIRSIVENFHNDEKYHLEYIMHRLDQFQLQL